jgi:hypothetical protein|tara:strand:- start:797 stop:1060 length:264 start_codon:yes stop_codon:yes gene_type:complete
MIKITTIAALATLATSSAVFAGGHNTTAKDRAQNMTEALKADPGFANIASTLRPGGPLGTGGWGNIGSSLVNDGTPVSPANPKKVGE